MKQHLPIIRARKHLGPRVHALSAGGQRAAGVMLALTLWMGSPFTEWLNHQAMGVTLPATPSSPTTLTPKATTPPPNVTINRHVPTSAPFPTRPTFSAEPTEDEIFRAAIFEEPLIPIGRKPTSGQNRALAEALTAYLNRSNNEDYSSLSSFLEHNPDSPWRVALLVNLGLLHYRACRFSQTFPAWEEAWRLGKDATDMRSKALVDRAVGELLKMNARVGRMDKLESLLAEIGDRSFVGRATELVSAGRQGLALMKAYPWKCFRCGPLALDRILAFGHTGHVMPEAIFNSRSTTNGFSLSEVVQLSDRLGMKMQPAKRSPGARVPIPAVINWKVGHYAALVKEAGGQFLVQDPTFGKDLWISLETVDNEASGYFLIKEGALPDGWRPVDVAEAARVFGKGQTTGEDPSATSASDNSTSDPPDDPATPPSPPTDTSGGPPPNQCGGMAIYTAKEMLVSLHIQDTPVGHSPPFGPPIWFTISYNQRDDIGVVNCANFGFKWSFDWLSFVTDNPSNLLADVNLYLPGGGSDAYTGFNPTNQSFAPQVRSRETLVRSSGSSYTLLYPDGSQHIFGWPVGSGNSRNVFLTRVVDSRGNGADLIYDVSNRLAAVVDSIGQVSTLSFELTNDPYKITRITDPFGRYASFQYDSSGRLTNITDVIGINSSFGYDSGDFIQSLTTPYGTSHFAAGEVLPFAASETVPWVRWLEMTDPEGGTERLEYRDQAPGILEIDPLGAPKTMTSVNQYLIWRNTFYWDKKAFADGRSDYSKARLTHWLHDAANPNLTGRVPESRKNPLENRVWQTYPGQGWAGGITPGMIGLPSKIGRILDDGSTQLYQYEYNNLGRVTKAVDPVGRTTEYLYHTNLLDLLEVRQTAGVNDLLTRTTYNKQHLPLTVADGSGHTNFYAYNAVGQLLILTNPRGDTTTFNYDTNGYLLSIDGPLPGTNDTTSFTYDVYGHVRTITDSEGYKLTYDYDALDRLTRITYPDGTYDEKVYDRLDLGSSRDRNGRITRYTHDGNRHLIAVGDPLHRATQYEWCACGQMAAMIDPMGRRTQWHRDIQGRVVAKEYVDGSQVQYAYEGTTSRLKSVTDEKGQVKLYDYWLDNNLRTISYLNTENPTPDVTFTYDAIYNRLKTMTDGIGTTTWTYNPAGVLGALRVAMIAGPWTNAIVAYQYDNLGRVINRAINGTAQTYAFDSLGRLTNVVNALGSFVYNFDGATARPLDAFCPNGQSSHFTYFNNMGDRRLRQIIHQKPNASPISSFAYNYNPFGDITNFVQQLGAQAQTWSIGYDDADQLLSVKQNGNDPVNYAYAYDPVANRLYEATNSGIRSFSYNALNQLVASSDIGETNTTYQWDAEQRLVGILQGTVQSRFYYDGLGRRLRIVETSGGVVQADRRFVWCGAEICEEWNSNNAVVNRYFGQGEQQIGTNFFYLRDQLGSIREFTDNQMATRAEYAYAPYGGFRKLQGDLAPNFLFAGYFAHPRSGLLLAQYRAYNPGTARWLSRDPIGESGGVNLYGYVAGNPMSRSDPRGNFSAPVVVGLIIVGITLFNLYNYHPPLPPVGPPPNWNLTNPIHNPNMCTINDQGYEDYPQLRAPSESSQRSPETEGQEPELDEFPEIELR